MKQSVRNLKQQKIYRRRRVALAVVLILLVALIIAIYASTSSTKVANTKVDINGESIDISQIISTDANPPTVRRRNDTNKMGWYILGNNN